MDAKHIIVGKLYATCSICGELYPVEYGNNAQPVNDGRCCTECNVKVVIPARINALHNANSAV